MAWILVQTSDYEESNKGSKNLVATGECDSDLDKKGARLRPVTYGSRLCTNMDKKFHSFVG